MYSCDPGQILNIKVAPKPNLFVKIYGDKDVLPYSVEKTGKAIIRVPSSDTSSDYDKSFMYRIGNWKGDAIVKFSNNIDSIILNTTIGKIVLIKKPEIIKCLKQHRSGSMENVLTIQVN